MNDRSSNQSAWRLVVHGGAGVIERTRLSAAKDAEIRAALSKALEWGSGILEVGGSALDAVEAAVRVLEDDPNFNAGYGSVLTVEGKVELDASIMDGCSKAAGAVAGVRTTRNPVSLARAVMERSDHVLLGGSGTDAFAREVGLEQVTPDHFITADRRRQLEELMSSEANALDVEYKYGTVGAVALDSHGHVAAATSTGGMTAKRWGRIGDSPVIGAGTYADHRSCAVSGTGWGEYFLRVGVAHEICARVRLSGDSPQSAAIAALEEVRDLGGQGGVIFVSPAGHAGWHFNTPGMYRGLASPEERKVALYSEEEER
jgi:L-asparaginase / beta-aspartyl-peptidase